MKINDAGIALIKEFESLRLTAYRCPVGKWTIGWGHTSGVKAGDTCTVELADAYLRVDCGAAEDAVDQLIKVPLTSNQFSALVSFVFNVGREAFRGSTLKYQLNLGRYDQVPVQLMRWNKGFIGGKLSILPGLTRRRNAEAKLWDTPDAKA